MSRRRMWETRYRDRTLMATGKPTNSKRDLQNHRSYGLLACDLRVAKKEVKIGFSQKGSEDRISKFKILQKIFYPPFFFLLYKIITC